MEILIGVLIIAAGVSLAFFLRGGSSSDALVTKVDATAQDPILDAPHSRLLSGEAFVPIAVEAGNLPPDLGVGDQVRVIVTPSQGDGGTARGLEETTIVHGIESPGDLSTRFVVTVRAPESVATAIAASGPVFLAIIGKEDK